MEENNHYSRRRRSKIDSILIDVQRKLRDTHEPVLLNDLNAFERKRIHRFFDNREEFETKTYRNGDEFTLYVYPVGNLKKFAAEKAQEALDSGNSITLPPMGNYERYIVHDCLKDFEGVETTSFGEGNERRVEIRPAQFGRGLKKIMKKIKLF